MTCGRSLYDMTKTMMNDMNVEFEYQIRHNLKDWSDNRGRARHAGGAGAAGPAGAGSAAAGSAAAAGSTASNRTAAGSAVAAGTAAPGSAVAAGTAATAAVTAHIRRCWAHQVLRAH